jgi:hypothetical protein
MDSKSLCVKSQTGGNRSSESTSIALTLGVKNCLYREAGKGHHHRQLDKGVRRKWNSGADMGATLVSQAIWQGAPGTIARRVLLADGPKQRLSSEQI